METNRGWFKSSHSHGADDCVEVKIGNGWVAVRDSKNPDGPKLATAAGWSALIFAIKRGDLDAG